MHSIEFIKNFIFIIFIYIIVYFIGAFIIVYYNLTSRPDIYSIGVFIGIIYGIFVSIGD